MNSAITIPQTLFHVSLNVNDLARAIAFYRHLLGVEPAKQRDDYAKFELDEPPLVLSLEPQRHARGGALNHLGLRVADAESLVDIQKRLELAGISTQRENNVACCYARQTKFWVADPDQNQWEVYVLEEDIEQRGSDVMPPALATPEFSAPAPLASRTWEHHLGDAIPSHIEAANGSLDSVLLRGTFNAKTDAGQLTALLKEAKRALRNAGKITVHGLVADQSISELSRTLPGPASAVQYVPQDHELFVALEAAGFRAIHATKLSQNPVFEQQSTAMRELMLVATKAEPNPFALQTVVIYKGPFQQVIDDFGSVFPRGRRITVTSHQAEVIRSSPGADSFLFLVPCCTG